MIRSFGNLKRDSRGREIIEADFFGVPHVLTGGRWIVSPRYWLACEVNRANYSGEVRK
jgi:hypothetical protein